MNINFSPRKLKSLILDCALEAAEENGWDDEDVEALTERIMDRITDEETDEEHSSRNEYEGD